MLLLNKYLRGVEFMGTAIAAFFESIGTLFSQIWFAITTISLFDILDIIIVAFIVYAAGDS